MLKIEIRDDQVESAMINGRNGQFKSEKQTGWLQLPNGETRRVRVRVTDGKPYAVGLFVLSDESFIVSQYGDLQLGALKLIPANDPSVKAANK